MSVNKEWTLWYNKAMQITTYYFLIQLASKKSEGSRVLIIHYCTIRSLLAKY